MTRPLYVMETAKGFHPMVVNELLGLTRLGVDFRTAALYGNYSQREEIQRFRGGYRFPDRWPLILGTGSVKPTKGAKGPSSTVIDQIVDQVRKGSGSGWEPTIVHGHFGRDTALAAREIAKRLRLPLSLSVHTEDAYASGNDQVLADLFSSADCLIVGSKHTRNVLRSTLKEAKATMVRPFLDVTAFRPMERRLKTDTGFNLLMVGRLIRGKGHKVLFRAVRDLDRNGVHIWVVGDGPEDLKAMAGQLGLRRLVTFFGRATRFELLSLYNTCGAYVHPSIAENGKEEGNPLSMVEAMSFGKSVLASDMGGLTEIVRDGRFTPGDHEELAALIDRTIDGSVAREALEMRNRRRATRHHSLRSALKVVKAFDRVG